jgi:hypothetical protein
MFLFSSSERDTSTIIGITMLCLFQIVGEVLKQLTEEKCKYCFIIFSCPKCIMLCG